MIMNPAVNVWNNCLILIKDNIPPYQYKTWFEPIVPYSLDGDALTIQVPSIFCFEYLEEHFVDLISKCLRKEIGPNAKLEYKVVVANPSSSQGKPDTVNYPNTNKVNLSNPPVSFGTNSAPSRIVSPFAVQAIERVSIDPQLNQEYAFDNLIVGDSNKFAYTAGVTIAKNPGKSAFNPLFIHGNSGLGKTHVAQAIGIEVKKLFPEKQVLYVSANKFQNQYVLAVAQNNTSDFINFYQYIDVLILDDVHEFAGKNGTQNVFFHIFNHLQHQGKQLILTSDKAPVALQGMEERLLSRFKWGCTAEITAPDYETRKAILQSKVRKDGLVIADEIISHIAKSVTTNVRELEGTIVSMLAQCAFNKVEITHELANSVLNQLVSNGPKKELTIESIQKKVCSYYKLPVDAILTKSRKREVVQARQVAMYFSKNFTTASLSTIGMKNGNRDHATVLHACKTVNNFLDTDRDFKRQLKEIELLINS